jgi:hypothetical protein
MHPAGNECQHIAGWAVEPMRIVGDEQQRSGLRGLHQEIQRRQGNQEEVWRNGIAQAKRRLQRGAVRRRKSVEAPEQRLQQLMQPGKRQMCLRLRTRNGQRPHPAGCRVLATFRHQRRFSDASLAAHDDSTAALTRAVDEVAQNA